MEPDEPLEGAEIEQAEDAPLRVGERPIYIARTLSDAQKLEEAFKSGGVEYDVEPGTYQGGIIFRSARVGAFFYVACELRDKALRIMEEGGFRPLKP